MVLARWQATIVDDAGNVLPGASVTVQAETVGNPLASLFTDRAGVVPSGNPITADGDGFAFFHVTGGAYRITASSGGFTRTWRYVGIGTAAEHDDDSDVPFTTISLAEGGIISWDGGDVAITQTENVLAFTGASDRYSFDSSIAIGTNPAASGALRLANTAWIAGRNAANNADLNMFRVNAQNFTEFSNRLYFDSTGVFAERNAAFTIERNIASPVVVQANMYSLVQGKGDNTTQLGVSAGYFQARDRSDVTGANKGVLYGAQFDVVPIVDRNNFPFDDVVGVIVTNIGSARGTEAVYLGHGVSGGGRDWAVGFSCEAHTSEAIFNGIGTHAYGLDFCRAGNSGTTFSASAIRIPNNTLITSRNAAGNADMEMLKLDASNVLQIGGGVTSIASSKAGAWTGLQTFTASGSFGQPIIVVSTNADAVAGPVIFLDRASASPAAADNIGQIGFSGRNASGSFTQYAAFLATILDTTAGSEDSTLAFQTNVAGTMATRALFGQGLQIGTPTSGDMGLGTLNMDNAIYRDGTQVVAARQTGWTAMTGTKVRTTADLTAPTAAQVGQRLAALIDDLITHGLIGT